jgi:hypothetical protein
MVSLKAWSLTAASECRSLDERYLGASGRAACRGKGRRVAAALYV